MAGLCEGGNEPPGSLNVSKFRREFKRTFLQCRCLSHDTSSSLQSHHFNNREKYHVSTASEYPMTTTVPPGSTSIRGDCFLPSSTTSSIRHHGRRHLTNNNEASSSRL
ncbi:hypothetical protein ANN_25847 [Periplaneta americana]|uniref:Uncharacterized protein n=1 Tax=Periplaneta americana TaxID=6978 RepID=A0ABQ8S4P6_PERAM|nr:hypothetical protein ANN_25847 [Periplaneta americana]